MTPSLEFKMSTTYSISRCRNNHTMVIFHFKVTNDDGQGKKHLSILVPMLIAKTTIYEHSAMVSCTFSLILIVT
jgi:hypothetical protein